MIFLIIVFVSLAFILYICYKHDIIINIPQNTNTNNTNTNTNHIMNLNHDNINNDNINNDNNDNDNEIEHFITPPSGEVVESGHCYKPNINNSNSTFELDTAFITQMSDVQDASQYVTLVNDMKQRYKTKLYETINKLHIEQNNIVKSLDETTKEFNKYGLETLSKQYYDTIFQHGDFEEIKDDIVLPTKITNINTEAPIVTP